MEHIVAAVLNRIEQLSKENSRLIVAIDGRCAAGKTTLAAQLKNVLSCNVMHMDDFFLSPEQRTEQRLQEPGGNVDHERFLSEVLVPLVAGQSFEYRAYNCRKAELGEPVRVEPTAVSIVEGSYSCHPLLKEFYHLKIFLSVDADEQIGRITRRNGESCAQRFRETWIPLEEKYFLAFALEQNCDLRFIT